MSAYVPILQEVLSTPRQAFDQLIDRAGELVITLDDANGCKTVCVFGSYLAYRKLDEGDALLTLADMRRSGGTGRCIYRVEGSDFLTWFNTERCGATPGQVLVHYVIAAANDIIDVLSLDPPIVESSENVERFGPVATRPSRSTS